jgi:hypothetical protein
MPKCLALHIALPVVGKKLRHELLLVLPFYTKPMAPATFFCVFFKPALAQEWGPKLQEESMRCLMAKGHGREKTRISLGTPWSQLG